MDRLSGYLINLPNDVLMADDHLFVASTVANTILSWEHVEDGIAGHPPDKILGASKMDTPPGHGNGLLFWPGALDYENGVLWIGEFKFSDRLWAETWTF